MSAPLGFARAVVFDLDGTLVDSLDDIVGHLNAALVDAGVVARTRDEVRGWVGGGAEQLVARAVIDPAVVPDVLARFRTHYRASPHGRTRIYDGLGEALDRLARDGRVFAVLSNKPHDLVVEIADRLLARWRFGAVVGERAGHPRKPDPRVVLAMLGELGVAPERSAFVGDSAIDVATARAAGMPSVAVSWGLRDCETISFPYRRGRRPRRRSRSTEAANPKGSQPLSDARALAAVAPDYTVTTPVELAALFE